MGLVALALLAIVAMAVFPAAAVAKKKRKPGIYVNPGPDAIANAIDRANPGQTIRIRRGRLSRGAGGGQAGPADGRGQDPPGDRRRLPDQGDVSIVSPGVTLRRLKVVGASEGFGNYPAEVDFNQVNTGRARGLIVKDSCDAAVRDQHLRHRARGHPQQPGARRLQRRRHLRRRHPGHPGRARCASARTSATATPGERSSSRSRRTPTFASPPTGCWQHQPRDRPADRAVPAYRPRGADLREPRHRQRRLRDPPRIRPPTSTSSSTTSVSGNRDQFHR